LPSLLLVQYLSETPGEIAAALKTWQNPNFVPPFFMVEWQMPFCRAKSKIAHILTSASTSALPSFFKLQFSSRELIRNRICLDIVGHARALVFVYGRHGPHLTVYLNRSAGLICAIRAIGLVQGIVLIHNSLVHASQEKHFAGRAAYLRRDCCSNDKNDKHKTD